MTNTKIRLAYQTESGLGLATINDIAEYPDTDPERTVEYIKWLEELATTVLYIQEINDTLTTFLGGDGKNKKG